VKNYNLQDTFTKAEIEETETTLKAALAKAVSRGFTTSRITTMAREVEKESSKGRTKFVVYNACYGGFGISEPLKDLCKEVYSDSTFHPDPNDEQAVLVEAAVRLGKQTHEGVKNGSVDISALEPKEDRPRWSPEGTVVQRCIKVLDFGSDADESKRRRAFLDLGLFAGGGTCSRLVVAEVGLREEVRIQEYDGFETVISADQ